jgi:hypothetical protein
MSAADLARRYPHLNLRWNMAQMDEMQRRARQGATADVLAFEYDTTVVEVLKLAKRNGFLVKPARKTPGLVQVGRSA